MTTSNKNLALREHLALISTEAYLLLKAENEDERINRYNMLQEQIRAIINVIDDGITSQYSCPDITIQ